MAGDPARANILLALVGGLALPAGELAHQARVTPQTASGHLGQMVAAGLLAVTRQGRHRYYRLASPRVAAMLEGVMAVAAESAAATAGGVADRSRVAGRPHLLRPLGRASRCRPDRRAGAGRARPAARRGRGGDGGWVALLRRFRRAAPADARPGVVQGVHRLERAAAPPLGSGRCRAVPAPVCTRLGGAGPGRSRGRAHVGRPGRASGDVRYPGRRNGGAVQSPRHRLGHRDPSPVPPLTPTAPAICPSCRSGTPPASSVRHLIPAMP